MHISNKTQAMTNYKKGILMVIGSAVCLSTSGFGLRIIDEANGWQIAFYRSMSTAFMIFLVFIISQKYSLRRCIRNISLEEILFAIVLGTGFVAYVFALLQTSIANALFIFSAAPFFSAILGWIFLRERVAMRTWCCIASAALGLFIMIGSGVLGNRLLGNMIALWLPISYAICVVLIRRSAQTDMLFAVFLASVIAGCLTIPFVSSFFLSANDLGASIYLGIFQVGAGFILLAFGAKHVPTAQVGLIALLEPVFASLWAWIVASEVPTTSTFIGGMIILISVALNNISIKYRR